MLLKQDYHEEALDTFADSQACQAIKFVQQLVEQHWLTNTDEAGAASVQPVDSNVVKLKADNLLRLTKSNAIKRLRSIA